MIEKNRLGKIWKRTVIQLLAVMMLAIAILAYFVVERIQTSSGPTFADIAIVFLVVLAAGAAFYLIARLIRDEVGRRYGKD